MTLTALTASRQEGGVAESRADEEGKLMRAKKKKISDDDLLLFSTAVFCHARIVGTSYATALTSSRMLLSVVQLHAIWYGLKGSQKKIRTEFY